MKAKKYYKIVFISFVVTTIICYIWGIYSLIVFILKLFL